VNQFAGDIPVVLIGNKVDLLESVGLVLDRDECRAYADDIGSIYIETSAKVGQNVEDGFVELTKRIVESTK
jgi:GTPase SAR1 family protein